MGNSGCVYGCGSKGVKWVLGDSGRVFVDELHACW